MALRVYLVFLCLLALACAQTGSSAADSADPGPAKENSPGVSSPSVADTSSNGSTDKQHFPVADFLAGEVSYVDSLPVGILQYRTSAGKMDSGYLGLEDFHRLAAEFMSPGLQPEIFSQTYPETSFFDKSTNTATFFYSTRDTQTPIRRIDVVSAKGDVYDEVTSIYMEKNYRQGDSAILKRLYWKPRRHFQIITQTSTGAGEPETEQLKVVWDNRE